MLRYVLGDTDFIDALKAYGAAHAFGTATTDDVKTAMEAEYGSSLSDFFDQWLYTPYRPTYSVTYEISNREGGYKVDVNLRQTQGHSVQDISGTPLRNYYSMPVEFTVHYIDATTETFSRNYTQRDQSFQLLTTKEPDYIVFDEDVHILKVAEEFTSADNDGIFIDGDYNGIPGDNPCTGGVTENCDDNCPAAPNGPSLGTCVKTQGGEVVSYRVGEPKHYITCTSDPDCTPTGGTCQLLPGDSNGNGLGDACECYTNFNYPSDLKVNLSDLGLLKGEYGNNECSESNPCSADANNDGKVNLQDLGLLKNEYGRQDCPALP
jgi:hypothetical protein